MITVIPPPKKTGEGPIQPYQIELIRAYSPDIGIGVIRELGEHQAESIIVQLSERQEELSAPRLTETHEKTGDTESADPNAGDQPEAPYESKIVTVEEKGGCLSILGYLCILWLFFHFLAVFLRFFL